MFDDLVKEKDDFEIEIPEEWSNNTDDNLDITRTNKLPKFDLENQICRNCKNDKITLLGGYNLKGRLYAEFVCNKCGYMWSQVL